MFFLCVSSNTIETKIEKKIIELTCVLNTNITRNGNDKPASIELRDTYLDNNNVTTNTPIATSVGMGAMANTIPVIVATPLPPLKPAKMGKT